jgi:hypothetical protein
VESSRSFINGVEKLAGHLYSQLSSTYLAACSVSLEGSRRRKKRDVAEENKELGQCLIDIYVAGFGKVDTLKQLFAETFGQDAPLPARAAASARTRACGCGICPNERSGAIVSAAAKARCSSASEPGGIPLASCRQHARCKKGGLIYTPFGAEKGGSFFAWLNIFFAKLKNRVAKSTGPTGIHVGKGC